MMQEFFKSKRSYKKNYTRRIVATLLNVIQFTHIAAAAIAPLPSQSMPPLKPPEQQRVNAGSLTPLFNSAQTGTLNNLSLSNKQLGMAGPLLFGVNSSDLTGTYFNTQYTLPLGERLALSAIGEYGSQQSRINGTLGFSLTEQTQIKLTAERFGQRLPFQFGLDTLKSRVHQDAYGVRFQKLFDLPLLRNINFGGYYANAASKNLTPIAFNSNNGNCGGYDAGLQCLLFRHIAGGTSAGGDAGIDFLLSPSTLISSNLYYDQVRYNTLYTLGSKDNRYSMGAGIKLNQLLGEQFNFMGEATFRGIYNTYQAGINWLPNTHLGMELSLNGQHIESHNSTPNNNSINFQINFLFDNNKHYEERHNRENRRLDRIIEWVSAPAVKMNQVLAKAEEIIKIVAPVIFNISPNSGPLVGGNTITITGTNFISGLLVFLGGKLAENIQVLSPTTLTIAVPPSSSPGSVEVVVQNPDGQKATFSQGYTYTSQSNAPATPSSIVLTNSAGTPISNGGFTNDPTPVFSGTADPGTTVTIYDGTTVLGTVVVGASGTWSFTSPNLANGNHSFTAIATDAAGNSSPSTTPYNFTVNTAAPATPSNITLTNSSTGNVIPSGGFTNNLTPIFSGTAEPGTTVTVSDGATVLGTVVVGASGTWSFTSPNLANGNHSFTTIATDVAGNLSPPSTAYNFTVDTTAPATPGGITLTDSLGNPIPQGTLTADPAPVFSGTAQPGTTVSVSDGTTVLGTVVVGASGTWSFTSPNLANGNHSFTAIATDAAGNSSPSTTPYNFTVNTAAPATPSNITLTNNSTGIPILNGGFTNDPTPVYSGTAEPGTTVSVSDGTTVLGTTVVGTDGTWSFTSPNLAEGSHSFTAIATDTAGNSSASTTPYNFTVDTTPPVTPGSITLTNSSTGNVIPNDGFTNNLTPVYSGTAEPGTTVSVSDGTTVLGTVVVGASGTWSFTSPTLANGNHSFTAIATDAAGNSSPSTTPYNFTVDTTAPATPGSITLTDSSTGIPILNGGFTNDPTPVYSGTAEPGTTVSVSDGTTVLGTIVVDASGTWSFTSPNLAEGSHSFTAIATDSAGNSSPSTTPYNFTVDTTPPATPDGITLTNSSTGNVIPNDGLTNDPTPVFSGTAEPGATVSVSDGATVLGTTVVGTDGTWSFTSPTLANSNHSFTAIATDAAGNSSASSTPYNFTVDTTAPATPGSITLTNSSTGIPILNGGFTNDPTPVYSGTAEPGTTVSVSDGTTVLGTAVVNASGTWSFTSPNLAEGSHSFTAKATDAAGNSSAPTATYDFTVDTTVPATPDGITLTNSSTGNVIPNDGFTNDPTPVYSGTAEPGTTVSVSDGATVLGTAVVGTDGTWSFTSSNLAEGSHSFTAIATDAAGNSSPSSTPYNFTVDTTAPAIPGSITLTNSSTGIPILNGGFTNDPTPVYSGTAEPGTTISVSDGTTVLGTAVVDASGTWSFTSPNLAEGSHSFTAKATDAAGNSSPSTPVYNFTVDTTAPVTPGSITLTNSSTGNVILNAGFTNDPTPVYSGTAEPGTTISVSDGTTVLGTTVVGTDGTWSFTSPNLAEGSHSFTAIATDAAGNSSASTTPYNFTVDTTPPATPDGITLTNSSTGIPIPNDGFTNDPTPVYSGTAEPGTTVSVSDGATVLGTAVVGTDGTWSFTSSNLAEGSHSFTAIATDAAGNSSTSTTPYNFTVDTTAPATPGSITLTNSSTGIPILNAGFTNDPTPVYSGTAEPGTTVSVSDGTTVLGTAVVNASGTWSFTSPNLAEGSHSFTAKATDAAGNSSAPTATYDFTVDTIPPLTPGSITLTNSSTGNVILNAGFTNDPTPVYSGAAEPGTTISVSDGTTVLGTTVVGTDGTWSFTSPNLAEGSHSFTAIATDAAGNSSASTTPYNFTVDTTAPATPDGITLTDNLGNPIPQDSSTADPTPIFSGTAEADTTVSVSDGTTVLGTVVVDASGAWSFTSPNLADGNHSFTAKATDAAGNSSASTTPYNFIVTS